MSGKTLLFIAIGSGALFCYLRNFDYENTHIKKQF